MLVVFKKYFRTIGSVLLITGTAIGIGMLAMPAATIPGGFVPAAVNYLLCWIFTTCTGLLILEACLWMPHGANFTTLTKRLLGPLGGNLFWAFYLFFFLMGMISHIIEGGQMINLITASKIPAWVGSIIYPLIFLPIIYLGINCVDRVNIVLIAIAAITFLIFIFFSIQDIDLNFVKKMNWSKSWLAFPILMFAFSYQLIIPSLTSFLRKNIKIMRKAIIIGTVIPFVVYLIWDFLILGLHSSSTVKKLSIFSALEANTTIITDYNISFVFLIGLILSLILPAASFATFSLAFRDFLSDGIEIEKSKTKKRVLCFFMFLIPTILAVLYPNLLLIALRYAGGINVAIIFGLMPPLMVWIGRYYKRFPDVAPQVPGGKITLAILIAFALLNIIIQLVVPF